MPFFNKTPHPMAQSKFLSYISPASFMQSTASQSDQSMLVGSISCVALPPAAEQALSLYQMHACPAHSKMSDGGLA